MAFDGALLFGNVAVTIVVLSTKTKRVVLFKVSWKSISRKALLFIKIENRLFV